MPRLLSVSIALSLATLMLTVMQLSALVRGLQLKQSNAARAMIPVLLRRRCLPQLFHHLSTTAADASGSLSPRIAAGAATLDVNLISQNMELVKSHLTSRHSDPVLIDVNLAKIAELRAQRQSLIADGDAAKRVRNTVSGEIGKLLKVKGDEEAEAKVVELKKVVENAAVRSSAIDAQLKELETQLEELFLHLPNLLDDRVSEGAGEENNVVVHTWSEERRKIGSQYSWHDELAVKLNGLNIEAATRMSGARFSVLFGDICKLERALMNYFLDFMTDRGYQEVAVPLIVSRSTLQGTGQLPKFEDDLFKVSHNISGEDAFLIPTAEVPVTNIYKQQIIDYSSLPIRHVSCTPCFRAEAGSYGRDTRGLMRQHQFYKVEMIKITSPETSNEEHELMTRDAEDLLKSLDLPFRRVALCSGDIGFSARICYDLEVWMPGQQTYREISSISNCYDFQSRRMSLRYKSPDLPKGKTISSNNKKMTYPHTLNGSGVAVGRALVAILENHQQPDGSIALPSCLHRYMGKQVLTPPSSSK